MDKLFYYNNSLIEQEAVQYNKYLLICSLMETAVMISPKKQGERLVNAERTVLISKLVDLLCEGYISTNSLSKKLKVSRDTIETYRPLADELIGKLKLDRNVIRNLQIRRTYELIEGLIGELKQAKTAKDKTLFYNQIYKFSSHLALITGLNVETHVNIDPQKLVIIRSSQPKQNDRVIEQTAEETINPSTNS